MSAPATKRPYGPSLPPPANVTSANGSHAPAVHAPPRQSCPHDPQLRGSVAKLGDGVQGPASPSSAPSPLAASPVVPSVPATVSPHPATTHVAALARNRRISPSYDQNVGRTGPKNRRCFACILRGWPKSAPPSIGRDGGMRLAPARGVEQPRASSTTAAV